MADAEIKWPIGGKFLTKKEIVSELIWIQEFLDESVLWGKLEEELDNDLAKKYSISIDRILESLDEITEEE